MFTEGRKEGSKQAWKCQEVGLVIILYESGLARLNHIGKSHAEVL
jgi:hypothetical protein